MGKPVLTPEGNLLGKAFWSFRWFAACDFKGNGGKGSLSNIQTPVHGD